MIKGKKPGNHLIRPSRFSRRGIGAGHVRSFEPDALNLTAILAMMDEVAEMAEGEFDSVKEIHQIRKDRDEQILPNRPKV
jgi:hypothetical protein